MMGMDEESMHLHDEWDDGDVLLLLLLLFLVFLLYFVFLALRFLFHQPGLNEIIVLQIPRNDVFSCPLFAYDLDVSRD